MRKLILVVHTSLDGYVASPEGELSGFDASEENLEFVCKLTEDADAALFGRKSYELINGAWPTAKDKPGASPGEIAYSNWYNRADKIVISKTLKTAPGNTKIISLNIVAEVLRIKNEPGQSILIFGSPAVAQLLMNADMIDDYWIFINPSIFGKGIPLFAPLNNTSKLKLLATQQFQNGEIALHYVR